MEGFSLAVVLQLHAAALSSLRSEVAELNARLVAETRAREATEAALVRAELQAARAEQKVEQQAARHEERLTELHSVIAELGRQLERHRATVIAEEDESGKGEATDSVNPCDHGLCLPRRTEIYYEPRLFDVLTLRGHPFSFSQHVAKIYEIFPSKRDDSRPSVFFYTGFFQFFVNFVNN